MTIFSLYYPSIDFINCKEIKTILTCPQLAQLAQLALCTCVGKPLKNILT